MNSWHEQDCLYSLGTDFLIIWGEHLLERPEVVEEMESLSDKLASWDKSVLLNDLQQNWRQVVDAKAESVSFFAATPLLSNDFTDKRWIEAVKMLRVFDHVLQLWHGVDDVLKSEAANISAELEKAYDDICNWLMTTDNFTSLRLTPMNEHRLSQLKLIPEASHYLYPWYADFIEISADTLEQITKHWTAIRSEGYQALSFIPKSERALVWDCLKRDSGLQAAINACIAIDHAIIKAIDNSMALRLFYTSRNFALNTAAPKKVIEAGMARVACAILSGKNTDELLQATPHQVEEALKIQLEIAVSFENILLAAFCGPYISDGRRLDAFKWVESQITANAYAFGDGNEFLTIMELWRNNEATDSELAKAFVEAWDKRADAALAPSHLLAKQLPCYFFFVGRYVTDHANCSFKANKFAQSGDAQDIPAPSLLFEDTNSVIVHTDIHSNTLDLFACAEDNERLNALWEDVKDAQSSYMMGWGLIDPDTVEPLLPKQPQRYEKEPVSIPEKEYDALVFAISDVISILKKIRDGQDISEDEKPRVKWITYLAEKT